MQVQACPDESRLALIRGISPLQIFVCVRILKKRFEFKDKNPSTKKMNNNNPILDRPIEEINEPVMKPTPYVPKRKPNIIIKRYFDRFADEMVSYVPEQKKEK